MPAAPLHTAPTDGVRPGDPKHVALIMDGNGRWAEARGVPRIMGHREGVKALKRTVEAAPRFGIRCLTVFGFSTENWSRPADEVSDLMGLVRSYVTSDLRRLERAGVRVRVLGRRSGLPADIVAIIDRAESTTAHNEKFLLQVAFNYGGRADIVDAARALVTKALSEGLRPEDITDEVFQAQLSTGGLPDPDLVIRTSGELRLSNFLLWETAYSEFVFPAVLWPDFTPAHLKSALDEFQKRERRYGTVTDDVLVTN
jgi:undecaprenyl diphosphate synthase